MTHDVTMPSLPATNVGTVDAGNTHPHSESQDFKDGKYEEQSPSIKKSSIRWMSANLVANEDRWSYILHGTVKSR
jgi:hypothetical protein